MQDIKKIETLYPFDMNKYINDLSQYPSDLQPYVNPTQLKSSSMRIEFNSCANRSNLITASSGSDSKCVCNNSKKVTEIIQGTTFYTCK